MWMTATAPAGWLFAHGQTFTAAQYPELALVFPSLKLPDLRGGYMRCAGANAAHTGWGDASYVVGAFMEDTTRKPRDIAFTTDSQGDHRHIQGTPHVATEVPYGLTYEATPQAHVQQEINWNKDINRANTSTTGAHTHTINGGGDVETRPKTFLVEMIIKATDQTITLVS
jgi:hypothetical protein